MTTSDIESVIADLQRWQPLMRDLAQPSLQAIHYTHAHATGIQADSQPERAAYTADQLENDLSDLETIASILADDTLHGASLDAVLDQIREHHITLRAWPDLYDAITRIHARWQDIIDPPEEPSDHLCPMCGTTRLHYRHTDHIYACPACEYTGTAAHVHTMRRWIIRNADTWITRDLACQLYQLTPDNLRWHVRANNLHPHDGLYSTIELRRLPRRGEILPP